MTLTELRYLVAVARELHFGRAAQTCFVSQPTLSIAIKRLEDELGVTLLERRKHDVRLTDAGERVVNQARRVLDESEKILDIARSNLDPLKGELGLGAIYTIGPYLFPHLIPILGTRAPLMPLRIEENYTAKLAERLKQGEIDAILVALPFEESGIRVTPLYREPFVCLLPSSHHLQEKQLITRDDLAQEKLLLLGSGHCFRDQALEYCPECRSNADKTLEGGSIETIRHMVASGNGITILPCSAAGADRYAQRLIAIRRFQAPAPSRTVALAWRDSYPRAEAIDVICQAIRDSRLSCVEPIDSL